MAFVNNYRISCNCDNGRRHSRKKITLAEFHYITRDDQNVVTFASTFRLPAWPEIYKFEVSIFFSVCTPCRCINKFRRWGRKVRPSFFCTSLRQTSVSRHNREFRKLNEYKYFTNLYNRHNIFEVSNTDWYYLEEQIAFWTVSNFLLVRDRSFRNLQFLLIEFVFLNFFFQHKIW